MANLRVNALEGRPLLDLLSFARRGPGRRDRLSSEELALIGRTVRHVPEVMVKVLTKDNNNLPSVARHLNYIGRRGDLALESDDGAPLQGQDAGQRLVEDWDLNLDQDRRDNRLAAGTGRAPKLVHKIMLSMPPGTPAKGVLAAARNFAREEFALKHRYALVLHIDEPHPHVHLVVKAVSEQGERLNIRKATLRWWRQEFARHLRGQGIAANATERAVRGETRTPKKDGIYRAMQRGESVNVRKRAEAVASALARGRVRADLSNGNLVQTRISIEAAWRVTTNILIEQGQPELACSVSRFVDQMPPPETEQEQLVTALRHDTHRVRHEHTKTR